MKRVISHKNILGIQVITFLSFLFRFSTWRSQRPIAPRILLRRKTFNDSQKRWRLFQRNDIDVIERYSRVALLKSARLGRSVFRVVHCSDAEHFVAVWEESWAESWIGWNGNDGWQFGK